MRILYTTDNIIFPYSKPEFILPLFVTIAVMLILSVILASNGEMSGLVLIITMIIPLGLLLFCGSYEEKQGCKYYVFIENDSTIDLDKYEIEEQKGDLYIITDK